MNAQEAIERVEEQLASAKNFQYILQELQTPDEKKNVEEGIAAMEIVLALAKEYTP